MPLHMGFYALEFHFGAFTLGTKGGLLAMVGSLLGSRRRLINVGGSVLRTNLVLLAPTTQIVVCDIDSRVIPQNVLGRLVTTVNTPPPTQPGLSELLHSYKVR